MPLSFLFLSFVAGILSFLLYRFAHKQAVQAERAGHFKTEDWWLRLRGLSLVAMWISGAFLMTPLSPILNG